MPSPELSVIVPVYNEEAGLPALFARLYPALHLFSLYRQLGFKEGDFPHAEDVGRRIVTLPLFPAMADNDVDRVVAALVQTLPGATIRA